MFELFPLAVGFMGSLHCLGMCGPLVLAYSLYVPKPEVPTRSPVARALRSGFSHHLAFHSGRLLAYGLLGAAAALLFQAAELGRLFFGLRNGMTLVSGILMVLLGLALLKVLPIPSILSFGSVDEGSFLVRVMHPLLQSGSVFSRMTLGFAVGFLPCCLLWAMLVTAAETRSPVKGFLTMAAFGLGTLPALFAAGLSSSLLSFRVRLLGEKAAALSVIAMGLFLVYKGGAALV